MNLGRVEDLQDGSLDRLIASLAKFSKKKWVLAEAEKLMVHCAKEWGLELIFRHLWDQLSLDNILKRHFSQAHTYDKLAEAIYAMVLHRISDPMSKRGVAVLMNGLTGYTGPHLNSWICITFTDPLISWLKTRKVLNLNFLNAPKPCSIYRWIWSFGIQPPHILRETAPLNWVITATPKTTARTGYRL